MTVSHWFIVTDLQSLSTDYTCIEQLFQDTGSPGFTRVQIIMNSSTLMCNQPLSEEKIAKIDILGSVHLTPLYTSYGISYWEISPEVIGNDITGWVGRPVLKQQRLIRD